MISSAVGLGLARAVPHCTVLSRGRIVLNATDSQRFWNKVYVTANCWLWIGARHEFGYGWFELNGKAQTAHTIAFAECYGPIPTGMNVCHECDNPPCVRPNHLFLGTQQDNLSDMREKNRHQKGETNGHAKLTEQDIETIRQMYSQGTFQRVIAAQYGVHQVTISKIVFAKELAARLIVRHNRA